MKRVFDKVTADCYICKTPTNGERRIGDKYYCAEHFQTESVEERISKRRLSDHYKRFKKIFQ